MAEIVTDCVCGQLPGGVFYGACGVEGCTECRPLFDADNNPIPGTDTEGELPALEPARREVDPLTLAACSDPFCAACLGQIAANEQASAPRKRTVFEPCEQHAAMYASETRYRRAEVMVEGGWAHSPCEGTRCRMRPGTDFYTADFVTANPVYYVGAAPQ